MGMHAQLHSARHLQVCADKLEGCVVVRPVVQQRFEQCELRATGIEHYAAGPLLPARPVAHAHLLQRIQQRSPAQPLLLARMETIKFRRFRC